MKLTHEYASNVMVEKGMVQPLEDYTKSSAKWKCECLTCGKIVTPRFSNVSRGHRGCHVCAVREGVSKRGPHPHKWSHEDASKIMVEKGKVQPLEDYSDVDKPWKCRCLLCDEIVTPTFIGINKQGFAGCKCLSRSHCKRGHPMDEDNIYVVKDGKERGCRTCRAKAVWEYRLKRKYGMTQDDYDTLLLAQDNKCPICGIELELQDTGQKRATVDHCHETGKVRAILCSGCNKGLGHYLDKPELLRSAANYLETYSTESG